MANLIPRIILWVLALAALILSAPLVIGLLLDTFGRDGSLVIVVLLFLILVAVGISRRRRSKAGDRVRE